MGSKNGKYVFESGDVLLPLKRSCLPSLTSENDENLSQRNSRRISQSRPRFVHQESLRDPMDDENERLSIVWLDQNVFYTKVYIDTEIKLKNLISYVRIFDRLDVCERYIKQIGKLNNICDASSREMIFFIISSELAPTIVPYLDELSQIKYIYVFTRNRPLLKNHQINLSRFRKVNRKVERENVKRNFSSSGSRIFHFVADAHITNQTGSIATLKSLNCFDLVFLLFLFLFSRSIEEV